MYPTSVPGFKVATALIVYGIETLSSSFRMILEMKVATALIVYGIETVIVRNDVKLFCCNSTYRLRY